MVSWRDRGRAIGLSETATLGGNVVGPMGLGRSLPFLQGRLAPLPFHRQVDGAGPIASSQRGPR